MVFGFKTNFVNKLSEKTSFLRISYKSYFRCRFTRSWTVCLVAIQSRWPLNSDRSVHIQTRLYLKSSESPPLYHWPWPTLPPPTRISEDSRLKRIQWYIQDWQFFSLSLGPLPYPYHRWTTFVNCLASCQHFNGLVQERRNSSASAMELHLSCTNPSSRFNPCVPILLLFVLLLIVMLEAHYHIHQHQYLYNWVMTDIISVSLYICLVKKQRKRTQRLIIGSPAFGPHPLKGNIIKTFQINNSISLRLLC